MKISAADTDRVIDRLRSAGCVFAETEARLLIESVTDDRHLDDLLERRCAGIPLEQILGWAEFCGRKIVIEPHVFVPRRRTQYLARRAAERARSGDVLVDLCCGSGAIATWISHRVEGLTVFATDIDPVAVHCAERNLGGRGTALVGDLFAALPPSLGGQVTSLVVNAPYVPRDAVAMMPPEARDFEPRRALDGGIDGLDLHRRIADAATPWLAPGGSVLIETSHSQRRATKQLFRAAGFMVHSEFCSDLDATIVVARRYAGS